MVLPAIESREAIRMLNKGIDGESQRRGGFISTSDTSIGNKTIIQAAARSTPRRTGFPDAPPWMAAMSATHGS